MHAKKEKAGLLNKDGCFLGVCPNRGFMLGCSLSPGDRKCYVSAKLAFHDVLGEHNKK